MRGVEFESRALRVVKIRELESLDSTVMTTQAILIPALLELTFVGVRVTIGACTSGSRAQPNRLRGWRLFGMA